MNEAYKKLSKDLQVAMVSYMEAMQSYDDLLDAPGIQSLLGELIPHEEEDTIKYGHFVDPAFPIAEVQPSNKLYIIYPDSMEVVLLSENASLYIDKHQSNIYL